eukprot:gene11378-4545_t
MTENTTSSLPHVLSQFESLVIQNTEVSSKATLSTDQEGQRKSLEQKSEKKEMKTNLHIIVNSIRKLCSNGKLLITILEKLQLIAENYSSFDEVPYKKRKKPKVEPLDYDDTIDCFILRMMRKCFNHYLESNTNQIDIVLPGHVRNFTFKRLDLVNYSPAVSRQAGLLLGSFSSAHFQEILKLYEDIFDVMKKEVDVKNFVHLQHSMRFLDFSFATLETADSTFKYIAKLQERMPGIKKGTSVLFPEIFATLKKIFCEILKNDKKRIKEWQAYVSKRGDPTFWTMYKEIYIYIAKLSKTAKYKIGAVDLMQAMIVRAPEDFYFSQNPNHIEDLFKSIQSGLKDKKEKFDYLDFFTDFVTHISPETMKNDNERISAMVKVVGTQIFQKKVVYTDQECDKIEKFLVELGKKNIHLAINLVKETLEGSYLSEQKAAVLKALEKIATEVPKEIVNYNYLIGPIVTAIIMDEKKRTDLLLLKNAITCFPKVKNPSEEKMKEIRIALGNLMLHTDSETRTNAALALNNFVVLQTQATVLQVIGVFTSLLLSVDFLLDKPEDMIRISRGLRKVLDSFVLQLKTDSNIQIDAYQYLAVRKRFEAMTLVWLCHTDFKVRAEAYRLLNDIKHDELKALTSQIEKNPPYLLDLLTIPKSETVEEIWLPELNTFLLAHSDNESVKIAFTELQRRWNKIPDFVVKYPNIIGNYLKLLCMGLKPQYSEEGLPFLGELLNLITAKSMQTHEVIFPHVIDALSSLNVEAIELFVKQLRAIGIQRNMNKKKEIETSDHAYEKNILTFFSRITKNIKDGEMIFDNMLIRDYLEELMKNWTVTEKLSVKDVAGSNIISETWKMAVSILCDYLKFIQIKTDKLVEQNKSSSEKEVVKVSAIIFGASLDLFSDGLYKLVTLSNPMAVIDTNAIRCLTSLLSFGEIKNTTLIDHIIAYLHNVVKVDPSTKNEVIDALSMLLKKNPNYIRRFIHHTFEETLWRYPEAVKSEEFTNLKNEKFKNKDEQLAREKQLKQEAYSQFNSNITLISLCYLTAVTNVLTTEIEALFNSRHVSLGILIFTATFHMCSPSMDVRNVAHELMLILCSSTGIEVGKYLSISTIPDEKVYKRAVLLFVQNLIESNRDVSAEIFMEADHFIEQLNAKDMGVLLQVIVPWAGNFGYVVENNPQSSDQILEKTLFYQFLGHAYSISNKLHSKYPEEIEKLWVELIGSQFVIESVCDYVIAFLLNEYKNALTSNQAGITQLIKSIVVYICRDPPSLPRILEILVFNLRSFKDENIPEKKFEFLVWQLKKGILPYDAEYPRSEVSVIENSIMQLLLNLTYENDLEFIPHLHKIFLNSVILFNSTQYATIPESKIILENLYQSLGFRHATKKNLKEIKDFKNKYFCPLSVWKYSREEEFQKGWVNGLLEFNDALASDISKLALKWAMKSADKFIILESLYLFYHLNETYDYQLLENLCLLLFSAIRVRDDEIIFILIKIFRKCPQDTVIMPNCTELLFKVAFWLLQTWNQRIFLLCLEFINHLYNIMTSKKNNFNIDSVHEIMFKSWEGGQIEADILLSQALVKGLMEPDSIDITIQFYQQFAITMKKFLPKNNSLIATNLLIHSIFISSGETPKTTILEGLFSIFDETLYPFKELLDKYMALNVFESTSLESFSTEFSILYKSIFGNRGGHYITFMLISLLKNGRSTWQTPALVFLSKLLPTTFSDTWEPQEYQDLAHVFRECMLDSDDTFTKAAENGTEFLLENVVCKTQEQLVNTFDYFTPIYGYESSVKGYGYDNKEIFIGATFNQRENSRQELLARFWNYFGLQISEEKDMTEGKEFQKMINYELIETKERSKSVHVLKPQDDVRRIAPKAMDKQDAMDALFGNESSLQVLTMNVKRNSVDVKDEESDEEISQ